MLLNLLDSFENFNATTNLKKVMCFSIKNTAVLISGRFNPDLLRRVWTDPESIGSTNLKKAVNSAYE